MPDYIPVTAIITTAVAAVIWVTEWLEKGRTETDDALNTCLTRRGSAL